jgi:hypothetical protein
MDSVAIPNFVQNICVKRRTEKEFFCLGGGGLVREPYPPTFGGGVREDDEASGIENCIRPLPKTTEHVAHRTVSAHFWGRSEKRRQRTLRR